MAYRLPPDDLDQHLRDTLADLIGLLNGGKAEPALMTGILSASQYGLDVYNASGKGARLRGSGGAAIRVDSAFVEIDGLRNVAISGDLTITAGHVRLDNNKGLQVKDSGGTYRTIAILNGSNQARIGSTSYATHLDGTAITANGPTTIIGAATVGTANTDAHTVIGVTTFRNAANTATQMLVDAGNNRVIVGSGTAMGSDTTPNLQVIGRLYVAPESANDTALQIRRSSGATTGWTIGVENSPVNLAFKDDSDTKVFAIGDAAATYQAIVTGDFNVSDDAVIAGDLSASRILAGNTTFPSGTYALAIDGDLRLDGYTSSSGGAAPATINYYWHVSFGGTTLKIPLYT